MPNAVVCYGRCCHALLASSQGASRMPMPLWISEVGAITLPGIAVVGAWIAFQQSRIAKQKLKVDLFERRFEIFSVLMGAMVNALNQSFENLLDEDVKELGRSVRKARFLFSRTSYEYMTRIETVILQCRHGSLTIRNHLVPVGPDGQRLIDEFNKDLDWLLKQVSKLPQELHRDMAVDDRLSFSRQTDVAALNQNLNMPH